MALATYLPVPCCAKLPMNPPERARQRKGTTRALRRGTTAFQAELCAKTQIEAPIFLSSATCEGVANHSMCFSRVAVYVSAGAHSSAHANETERVFWTLETKLYNHSSGTLLLGVEK